MRVIDLPGTSAFFRQHVFRHSKSGKSSGVGGSARVSTRSPLYYYLQINLCLECADREWCDFISWTPGAYKVIRVTRDRDLHGVLASTHYAQFYRAMCDGDGPPKFAKGEKEMIREMVEESRNAHMDSRGSF